MIEFDQEKYRVLTTTTTTTHTEGINLQSNIALLLLFIILFLEHAHRLTLRFGMRKSYFEIILVVVLPSAPLLLVIGRGSLETTIPCYPFHSQAIASTHQIVLQRIDEDVVLDHFAELVAVRLAIRVGEPSHERAVLVVVVLRVVRAFARFAFALLATAAGRLAIFRFLQRTNGRTDVSRASTIGPTYILPSDGCRLARGFTRFGDAEFFDDDIVLEVRIGLECLRRNSTMT